MIKFEKAHQKHLNRLQINTDNNSQLEFSPKKTTRAFNANRLIDNKNNDVPSNQSMVTEKISAQQLEQQNSFGFQSQTQTTSVILNPSINNSETTEVISPTEVAGISIPTSSTRFPAITKPLHIPTKAVRSNSDIHNDPRMSEKKCLKDNPSKATSHCFHYPNTKIYHFLILVEPKGKYQCKIQLLFIIPKFRLPNCNKSTK